MNATIIILNGASSSGKTSLLRAVQDLYPKPILDMGIDRFIFSLPIRYLERPLWDDVLGLANQSGKTGHQLIASMHAAILAASNSGMEVIADHVLVHGKWLQECARLYHNLPAWLIGIRCPLEVLEQREQSRKDRTLGQARLQFELIHNPGIYDLEVDTSLLNPAECAQLIVAMVTSGRPPSAFKQLNDLFTRDNQANIPADPPYPILRNVPIQGEQIENLRTLVGWDRMPGYYDRILANTYAHFSITTQQDLIAFVNVVSDGIADAFLVDLMVHPEFQEKSLGLALVQHAVQSLIQDGIRAIEVIFEPSLEGFYRKCGFTILQSGMIDNWTDRKSIGW